MKATKEREKEEEKEEEKERKIDKCQRASPRET